LVSTKANRSHLTASLRSASVKFLEQEISFLAASQGILHTKKCFMVKIEPKQREKTTKQHGINWEVRFNFKPFAALNATC